MAAPTATAASHLKRFRNPVLLRMVRARVAATLRAAPHNLSFRDARDAADDVSDDMITAAAMQTHATAPEEGEGFLERLLAFLSSEQFQQILKLILSLLGFLALAQPPQPAALPPPPA